MAIKIPHNQLTSEALRGVIIQFVTRDGPDSAHVETPFETKIARVKEQLDKGRAVLMYDPKTKTCNILPIDK
ncbi:MAG: YheU family protein [Proteobacteria bacterium]|nr:YheU family protein [Pseudomonadota bacterium]